jgi:hypothetical protein
MKSNYTAGTYEIVFTVKTGRFECSFIVGCCDRAAQQVVQPPLRSCGTPRQPSYNHINRQLFHLTTNFSNSSSSYNSIR